MEGLEQCIEPGLEERHILAVASFRQEWGPLMVVDRIPSAAVQPAQSARTLQPEVVARSPSH